MSSIDEIIANGPFQASWDSLKHYTIPDWYQDAKFGIFIHWGLYAVQQLLAHRGKLTWQRNIDGLTIQLPDQPPCQHAFVFKILGSA